MGSLLGSLVVAVVGREGSGLLSSLRGSGIGNFPVLCVAGDALSTDELLLTLGFGNGIGFAGNVLHLRCIL